MPWRFSIRLKSSLQRKMQSLRSLLKSALTRLLRIVFLMGRLCCKSRMWWNWMWECIAMDLLGIMLARWFLLLSIKSLLRLLKQDWRLRLMLWGRELPLGRLVLQSRMLSSSEDSRACGIFQDIFCSNMSSMQDWRFRITTMVMQQDLRRACWLL